jgi:hypothetical protein
MLGLKKEWLACDADIASQDFGVLTIGQYVSSAKILDSKE